MLAASLEEKQAALSLVEVEVDRYSSSLGLRLDRPTGDGPRKDNPWTQQRRIDTAIRISKLAATSCLAPG